MKSTDDIALDVSRTAVVADDPGFCARMEGLVACALPREISPVTRLIILGDDYEKFLFRDGRLQRLPCHRFAIFTSAESIPQILDLYNLQVSHYIFAGALFAREALVNAIAHTINAHPAGYHEFGAAPRILNQIVFTPATVKENHQVICDLKALLKANHWPDDTIISTELAAKEGLTNAFFHSFHAEGAVESRYDPAGFTRLNDDDRVTVTATVTAEWFHLQIRDNGGYLSPRSVAASIDRHIHQRGLFDVRGRGFYLMQNLSQRMVVTIEQGQSTSIDLYFPRVLAMNIPRHLELIVH